MCIFRFELSNINFVSRTISLSLPILTHALATARDPLFRPATADRIPVLAAGTVAVHDVAVISDTLGFGT